ncbi:hypothetical protein [Spirosoma radiotolerans]|uniref:hypothetical protein n=1 Tax=Spirosoma radiotolerans TaxID=1379870 RepID=UPI00069852EA|nr:hypothetical protein [Spirosoma radiotolerans]
MHFSDHFRALASYIRLNSPEGTQLITRTIQTPESLDYKAIKALLLNCWSAEYALRITPVVNDEQYLQSSLHWTFPQAYYSVLFSSRAFLAAMGNNISNENNIGRAVGNLIATEYYPHSLSFYAYGQNRITVTRTSNHGLVRIMRITRQRELKKNMCSPHNGPIGRTTFFNLMSRLRISSTDRDIEKMVNLDEFNVREFHADLMDIVAHINSVHECYVAQVLGIDMYRELMDKLPSYLRESFVSERLNTVVVPNVWDLQASQTEPF